MKPANIDRLESLLNDSVVDRGVVAREALTELPLIIRELRNRRRNPMTGQLIGEFDRTPDASVPELGKPKRGRPAKADKAMRRRGRSITVSVTLSGEVAKWAKEQATENFRTLEGEIAWCVAQAMGKAEGHLTAEEVVRIAAA